MLILCYCFSMEKCYYSFCNFAINWKTNVRHSLSRRPTEPHNLKKNVAVKSECSLVAVSIFVVINNLIEQQSLLSSKLQCFERKSITTTEFVGKGYSCPLCCELITFSHCCNYWWRVLRKCFCWQCHVRLTAFSIALYSVFFSVFKKKSSTWILKCPLPSYQQISYIEVYCMTSYICMQL